MGNHEILIAVALHGRAASARGSESFTPLLSIQDIGVDSVAPVELTWTVVTYTGSANAAYLPHRIVRQLLQVWQISVFA